MKALTNKQSKFVAAYLGRAGLNATEAARLAGYRGTRQTLASIGEENLRKPEIAAAIDEWRQQIKREGIADMEYRLSVLNELHGKLLTVIDERAAENAQLAGEDAAAPAIKAIRNLIGQKAVAAGAETGLIVRQVKAIGSGKSTQLVEEFAVDNPTIKSITALHDQAAKETGQRVEKHEHSGPGGGPIRHAHGVDLSALSDEELQILKQLRAKIDAAHDEDAT